MSESFPIKQFRLASGYTFDRAISGQEFQPDNVLVGGAGQSSKLEAFFLGKLAEYGHMRTNVWIDLQGAHAIYVMGKRRSGKTYTLGTIAEGLTSNQWIHQGTSEQAILVLDTMNVFTLMHHNVVDIYGTNSSEAKEQQRWGLNREDFPVVMFYPKGTAPPPEGVAHELAIRPADLSAEDWAAVFGVDTYSEPTGQLIAELHDKVTLEGYTDNDGNISSANPDYTVGDLLICLDRAPDVQRFQTQTIEAVRRRLRAIERRSIFSDTGTDIKDLFKPGQISVVLLRDIDHNLRGLLIGILVKKIRELRGSSNDYEKLADTQRKKAAILESHDRAKAAECRTRYEEYMRMAQQGLQRGWILIDEAHNYIPAKGIVASREPLKQYVNEGRNLGLSIVVATQQPSGLDPAIRRNADILIMHSMSMRDDIDTVRSMLNTFVPDSITCGRETISSRVFEQLVRSLDLGYAVVSNDKMSRIFPVKVRPRITIHGGREY
jgi:hypothetical protein